MYSKLIANSSRILRRSNSLGLGRQFSTEFENALPDSRKGLVLGVFSDDEGRDHKLTPATHKFNSLTGGKLEELLKEGRHLELGKYHIFQNLDPEFYSVAVVGVGREDTGYNNLENMDELKEAVRVASAVGARALRRQGIPMIHVDGMGHAESAAEGACLACWRFQDQKDPADQKIVPALELYFDEDKDSWMRGIFKAEAQNLARRLTDTPANLMTPTIFAQAAADALCACGVTVEIRDKDWCSTRKMNAFLSVAKGSCEPPKLVEMGYCGGPADDAPIVLCGKGITFGSGGMCLRECGGLPEMRGSMGGAAICVAVMRAAAALSLPINIQAVCPLCENMVSGMALKPGDHIYTMGNGKSVQVDHTDNDGRLVLADAIVYAESTFKPKLMIDIGSTSYGIRSALGFAATGVFSNSDEMWKQMEKAGGVTGDRVWRMPLWKHYTKNINKIKAADMTNLGTGSKHSAGPCRAAAFLREFVMKCDWMHLDTTGRGMLADTSDYPYLTQDRMTGSPTRTVIQFLYQLSCEQAAKR